MLKEGYQVHIEERFIMRKLNEFFSRRGTEFKFRYGSKSTDMEDELR